MHSPLSANLLFVFGQSQTSTFSGFLNIILTTTWTKCGLLIWNLETSQPDSIRVMGDKSTARDTMKNAGVPTVPGSDGLLQVLPFVKICCFMYNFSW